MLKQTFQTSPKKIKNTLQIFKMKCRYIHGISNQKQTKNISINLNDSKNVILFHIKFSYCMSFEMQVVRVCRLRLK